MGKSFWLSDSFPNQLPSWLLGSRCRQRAPPAEAPVPGIPEVGGLQDTDAHGAVPAGSLLVPLVPSLGPQACLLLRVCFALNTGLLSAYYVRRSALSVWHRSVRPTSKEASLASWS